MKPRRFRNFRPSQGAVRSQPAAPAAAAAPVHTAQPPSPAVIVAPASGAVDEEAVALNLSGGAALFDQARERWQAGDWSSLASVSATALQHSPDPGRLALMIAAAHLQLGQRTAAQQFLQRAQDWQVDRRLIAQTMIAGLHDTLGRAAALQGDELRAQVHFTCALTLASPGQASVSAVRRRAASQMALLDKSAGAPTEATVEGSALPSPGPAELPEVAAGPRALGAIATPAPVVAALRLREGDAVVAWLETDRQVQVQRLAADGTTVRARTLPLESAPRTHDGLHLAEDAQGHLLLVWVDAEGRAFWRRSTEPGDPRPWSAPREAAFRLGTRETLQRMPGSAGFAVTSGEATHSSTWRFDESRLVWIEVESAGVRRTARLQGPVAEDANGRVIARGAGGRWLVGSAQGGSVWMPCPALEPIPGRPVALVEGASPLLLTLSDSPRQELLLTRLSR